MKDVMKMSVPGAVTGTATPVGGGMADTWGRGWGVLGNRVSGLAHILLILT